MTLPASHRSLTVIDGNPKTLAITEKPLPVLDDEEILIKVVAVTLNPTDFKHVWNYASLKVGSSMGCDFAGDIAALGKDAEGKGFKVGDAVAGFLRGGIPDSANGSFQDYVKALPELTWHVPKEHLSYEDASSMGGIGLSTAAQSLYGMLKLPPPWAPAKETFPTIIWSGATSVGVYAIRLAKLSGLKVATTASSKNHEFMKSLGADVVFDYRDPEAPAKIKEWSEGQIKYGLDTISEHGSLQQCMKAFSDEGGKLITVLPFKSEDPKIDAQRVYVYSVLEKGSNDYKHITEWYTKVPAFAKQLKVMPLKRWPGGLDAIPEALQYLRDGKTSAQKISFLL